MRGTTVPPPCVLEAIPQSTPGPTGLVAVGQNVRRKDAVDKVTGQGQFVADLGFPGALHARIVRSPHPSARIVRIDTAAALRVEGVRSVVTGRQCQDLRIGICIVDQPPLAVDRVRFVGEPVAGVIAATPEAALGGAEALVVEYEPLPAVLDVEEAWKEGAALVHPDLGSYACLPSFCPQPGTNRFHHYKLRKGNPQVGFEASSLVVEHHYEVPHISHAQLEPHGAVARWGHDGTLTVWCSAQSPFLVRSMLAGVFCVPHGKVRVVVPYVGGGFGGKSDVTIEPLVAVLARAVVGRPVRLILTREEMFYGSVLGRGMKGWMKTGVDAQGYLQAVQARLLFNCGAYGEYAINIVVGGGHNCTGPYQIPHIETDSYAVYTNLPFVGAFRGYGHPEGHWMTERQLDLIARRLELDPVELRRRNLLGPGKENALGQIMAAHNGRPDACLDRVVQLLDWKGSDARGGKPPAALAQPASSPAPRRARGKGVAAFMKSPVMSTNAASSAYLRFNDDGTVTLTVGGVDIGQGSLTVLAQIAAEALKLPPEAVLVSSATDTQYGPHDWQTVASRTTWAGGNAVLIAARNAIGQLEAIAAEAWGVPADQVEYVAGGVRRTGQPQDFIPLVKLVLGYTHPDGHTVGSPVMAYGSFVPRGLTYPDRETGRGNCAAEWTFGCQGAEVEVDLETGEIRVLSMVTAIDAGTIINPQLARGQIVGAMAQGLGAVLSEQIVYDTQGRIRNPNLTDYKLPTPEDFQDTRFEASFVETPQPDGPYGARPLAEHAIVCVAPAVANALYNAVGVDAFSLPLTHDRVLAALKGGGEIA